MVSKLELPKPDPVKTKKATPKKTEAEEKAPVKIRQLDQKESQAGDTEEEEELDSLKYPKNSHVEAKMHNSWYVLNIFSCYYCFVFRKTLKAHTK